MYYICYYCRSFSTQREYCIKSSNLNCSSINVVYLYSCKACGQHYTGNSTIVYVQRNIIPILFRFIPFIPIYSILYNILSPPYYSDFLQFAWLIRLNSEMQRELLTTQLRMATAHRLVTEISPTRSKVRSLETWNLVTH